MFCLTRSNILRRDLENDHKERNLHMWNILLHNKTWKVTILLDICIMDMQRERERIIKLNKIPCIFK